LYDLYLSSKGLDAWLTKEEEKECVKITNFKYIYGLHREHKSERKKNKLRI